MDSHKISDFKSRAVGNARLCGGALPGAGLNQSNNSHALLSTLADGL